MSSACKRVRELLPAFAGGDLDPADLEAVRVHLLGCHACRGDAAGYRRALADLRGLADASVPGVDDAFFASMHGTVVATCAGGPMRAERARWWRWPLAVAAAAALVAVGFWWGHDRDVSVWDRPPLATTAVLGDPKAVPWAGPRVPLRLLGNDDAGDTGDPADAIDGAPATGGVGAGLRARDRLRSLVDDGMLLPPRHRTEPGSK